MKNLRINCLTLLYLITRSERKSELLEEVVLTIIGVEEVILASWCLRKEVSLSEPLGLGFRRFSTWRKEAA